MNQPQQIKVDYLTETRSRESIVSTGWGPSTPKQQQSTSYQDSSNNSTSNNKIYRTEIVIHPIPTTSIDVDVKSRCNKCKCLINVNNEGEIKLNNQCYHRNCFTCSICRLNLFDLSNNQFKLNDNGELKCSQCELNICSICQKSILVGERIIFDENVYHRDCFNCVRCRKCLIDEVNVYNSNCKPCCVQCYQQYFAPRCFKCSQPISTGKSTIFDGKNYHFDCFRCDHCDEILTDKQFPTHNCKPYCIRCYDQCFSPQCVQCLKAITGGKSIVYGDLKYHPECFRCFKCNEIITESKFHREKNKPCCIQCYNDYFALRCSKCSKSIVDIKYTTFQGKHFHVQCFVCRKCHRIIESKDKFYNDNLGILCSNCAI